MKKIFTILALTIVFNVNAQLAPVTESGNTGQRLTTSNTSNHGILINIERYYENGEVKE